MKLQFWGGTETVTGSMHLLAIQGRRLLRDAGLYQGRREESREINRRFPFDVAGLDGVVLSHAHIDHCGNLPSLARLAFGGPIHATGATVELCAIMLRDAARIQEQDAAYLNQKTSRRDLPPVEPLYTAADAERALSLFQGHPYGVPVALAPGATVTFRDAGHILGAALTSFDLEEAGRRTRLAFAVDLGRRGLPMIRDPEIMEGVETLVLESTYGNRLHGAVIDAGRQLAEVVLRTLHRGGKVLIPAFALERAQELLYHFATLIDAGTLPRLDIVVDSPMAAAVTQVFAQNAVYLDDEYQALKRRIGCIMSPPCVRFVSSVEESKAITGSDRPCVVIAASGMCEHGRILHHLKHGIEDARNSIVLVGYQAEHTLGQKLRDGARTARIFGDEFSVKAEVCNLDAFSAHADRDELIAYVKAVQPRRTFLVHGEAAARAALAEALRGLGLGGEVFTPARGDAIEL